MKENYLVRMDGVSITNKEWIQFETILKKGLPSSFQIIPFSIDSYTPQSKLPSISLDKFFKGDFHLNLSRLFTYQKTKKPLRLIGSPESLNIKDQINKIPQGNYVLVDDDSVSGFTVDWICNKLAENNIFILEKEFLVKNIVSHLIDVIDLKDFIFGLESAGLVSLLNDGIIVRVPYLHPFINLIERASLLKDQSAECSKELWIFNIDYHKERNTLTQNIAPLSKDFLKYLSKEVNIDLNEKYFHKILEMLFNHFCNH
jgi:hypothetical protein